MAVNSDELMTPLPADGSAVRDDLIYLGGLIGLIVPVAPSRASYQLVSMIGRWGTRLWNAYAIPALRAQFGDTAAGDWATLLWRSKGVDRNEATFASGPLTLENRSGIFHDVSVVGAVQFSYNGNTYVSQGAPPGSTGTLAIWPGSGNYPQTVLTFECTVVGTKGNIGALALDAASGYPAALASGPPGVYLATSASNPPAPNPALLGSGGEGDAALLARGRASAALGAPAPLIDKIYAVVLSTKLPGGIPVSTNRIRVVGANATVTIYCATPGGPTPGDVTVAGTELYEINARAQLLLGVPGLTVVVAAASALAINLGTITLYVSQKSTVTIAQATATANAALDLWTSTIVPVGGFRKTAGGPGYVIVDEVLAIAKSRVNATYPLQWLPSALYGVGDSVSNKGQTFTATSGGVSGVSGPTGAGGSDGGAGLVWAPTTATGSGVQFELAPGVFASTMPSFVADAAVTNSQIPVFTYSVSVVPVDQGA